MTPAADVERALSALRAIAAAPPGDQLYDVTPAEAAALLAEVGRLRRDALRYRWLRDEAYLSGPLTTPEEFTVWCVMGSNHADAIPVYGAELEKIMDAAITSMELVEGWEQ